MQAEESSLRRELQQSRPFRSAPDEAAVALMRTSDLLQRALAGVVEPAGITLQQYNVLRILRGSSPAPLPTLEISHRMIEQAPGITRLLDRLEAKTLVRRERCRVDRRQVHCWITPAGLELLDRLEAPLHDEIQRDFARLALDQNRQLISLLDLVRAGIRGGAPDCDPAVATRPPGHDQED